MGVGFGVGVRVSDVVGEDRRARGLRRTYVVEHRGGDRCVDADPRRPALPQVVGVVDLVPG